MFGTGFVRVRVAALLAITLGCSVGLGAAVAGHAATPAAPSIAIVAVPSSFYSSAPGSPVLPITAIGPAAGNSQYERFILTSASGTKVLQEPVGGGTPTATVTDLGSPSGGFPAMVSADGLDWVVANTDGVHGGLYAIDSGGNATRVAMPGYDPSQGNEQVDVFESMTVGPDGDLYLTDSGTGFVYRCAISATPSPSASCGPTPDVACGASPVPYSYDCHSPSDGLLPKSIASAGGELWINDNGRNIVSMTTSGAFAGPYAQGNTSFSPRTLVTADGFLWSVGGFADAGGENSEILKIDPSTGAVAATYQAGEALALTVDATGNIWYVGKDSAGASGVGELDPATGSITFTAAPAGSFVPYPENQYPVDPAGGEAIAPGPAGSNTLFFTGQDGSGAPIVGEVTVPSTTTTTTSTTTTTTTSTTTTTGATTSASGCEVRPEFRDESPAQLQKFISALRKMQQVPPGGGPSLYDKFVQLHLNESAVTHDFANFLPWHREFLLQFEQALQTLEPGVVIPYWDAAVDAHNPETSSLWNDATFGGNGNPNLVAADGTPVVTTGQFNNAVYQPFHHISLIDGSQVNDAAPLERQWSSASGAANTLGPFESAEQLNSLMTSSSYDKFRQALAYGEHGLVHNDIGGDMLTMASPNDPVFWMFHAWLDYVWSQWQAISAANANAYGGLNADGSAAKLSDTLPGVARGVTVGSVMSIHSLCYGYQPLSQPTPATASDSAKSLLRASRRLATSVSIISSASAITPRQSVTLIASSQSTQGAGTVEFFRDGRPILKCAAVPLRWTGWTWQATCRPPRLRASRRAHTIRAKLLAVGAYASSDASVAGGVRVTAGAVMVTFKRPRTARYGDPIGRRGLHAVARERGTFRYMAAPVTDTTVMRPVTARSVLAAGAYDLQARFTPTGHRRPTQVVTVQYVVTPAPLVIRPERKYMAVGQLTPQLTWVGSGFVHGDTPSSLRQSPVCVLAIGPLTIGNHKIWCQGGYSPNYTISYPSTTTLTVLRHACPRGSYCATDPPPNAAQRREEKRNLELICHPVIPTADAILIRTTRRHNGVRTATWRATIT